MLFCEFAMMMVMVMVWRIVLTGHRRHDSTIVLYDPRSRQLTLRSTSSDNEADLERCPTCHRFFRDESPHVADQGSNLPTSTTYMDPSYFRMLQHTLPESESNPRPTSPRRIDTAALDKPPNSGINTPPGTEFVASKPVGGHGISRRAFSPNYFRSFFKEERELGRGGKGVVLLVSHFLDGVALGQFACKRVPVGDDHAWLEKVLIEVQTLQNLSHPNLVSYRHVWLEDFQISNFGPSVPCAFILQQYCNLGDLHHYVLGDRKTTISPLEMKERMRRRSKGSMEDFEGRLGPRKLGFEEIYSFFKDITSGLHHLHSHGFIHRDIKPQNCLLNRVGSRIRVLLSDFGEVQVANVERNSTGTTGTVSYCAPEVLRRQSPRNFFGNFTVKSDVFSVGMIVHFLAFGGLPYINADDVNEENEDVEKLRAEIVAWRGFSDVQDRRTDLPEMLYKFLKRLLAIDPDERPSTEEILRMIRAAQDQNSDFDSSPPMPGDTRKPRISVTESPSPYPRASYRRKSSTQQQRPVLRASKIGQSILTDENETKGSSANRSATVQDDGQDIPDASAQNVSPSPIENTAMIRSRSKELGIRVEQLETGRPLSSPRLALPPPPSHVFQRAMMTMPSMLRVAVFVLKYWSITAPCSPLSPKPLVAYPLMLLAALDFMSERSTNGRSFFKSRSFYLLLLHVVIVSWTTRYRAMCETLHPYG